MKGYGMKTSKDNDVDWTVIEAEYRTGQLSIRMIASAYDIPESTIRYRANTLGWKRDLTEAVKHEVRSRLLRANLRTSGQLSNNKNLPENVNQKPDEEIINEAASRAMALLESHRSDIKHLRDKEQALLEALRPDATKTWVGQYQGTVITKDFSIPVTDKATAVNALASTMAKRIQLEREAFNLDETDRNADKLFIVLD